MSSALESLGRSPLFEGLDASEFEDVLELMQPRSFAANEVICREGEPGTSLFVIVDGLAEVLYAGAAPGEHKIVARLRSGDVVGELSLITGERRAATVVAAIPANALELGQEGFTSLVSQYPPILVNLTRILSGRLARMRNTLRERGEAVALVVGRAGEPLLNDVIGATEAASARSVAVLDTRESFESVLAGLDDALLTHGTVLVVASAGQQSLPHILDHAERIVVLGDRADLERLTGRSDRPQELVLVDDGGGPGSLGVIRSLSHGDTAGVSWLGRHLARTKLGLALGAGGAKGYAHVGALYELEEAGYTVDYVAGSSIGAVVGAYLASGMSATEVDAAMHRAFSPARVAEMFKLSLTGGAGLEAITEAFRETTGTLTFDDLEIPLSVMAVDLVTRRPSPVTDGTLLEGLLAATALAGMYPPFERDGQRLVDGLALVPVPTGTVLELGADVIVSVNIINRETLAAWPGVTEVPEAPRVRAGSRVLDTLLEVMDLSQLDSSVRHAELADVVVSPRFGPGSWKDFHLADLFLDAGRQATKAQLPVLRALARPSSGAPV